MAQTVALFREIQQVLIPSGSRESLKVAECIMAGFIGVVINIQDGI